VFDGKIDETEYQRVFASFEQDRPDALIVSEFSVHFTNRATIVELAAKHRLPTMYTWRDFVEIGGLMAYSPDFSEVGRSAGHQMGQILNGTNPGDIPYNQVAHYELSSTSRPQNRSTLNFRQRCLAAQTLSSNEGHFRNCEGLRMVAHDGGAARTGAATRCAGR
jgi:ABC transporter substrate binding protein